MCWLLFDNRKLTGCRNLLAKFLIAGSVFLLPMENALAVADLTTSSAAFASADLARDIPAVVTPYMDAGGIWDGSTEVSTIGDTFTLTITNTAGGTPAADTAFDLQDVILSVDAGFVLASNALSINKRYQSNDEYNLYNFF